MAVDNVLRNFDFFLEIDGINQFALQGVTPPTVEYTEHKQGSAANQPDKKTPGKKIVGDMVAEVVVNAEGGDPELWAKFAGVATGQRAAYIGTGFLIEMNSIGVPIQRFFIGDVWVKKIETTQYSTKGDNSADLMRTVTFSVEDYIVV